MFVMHKLYVQRYAKGHCQAETISNSKTIDLVALAAIMFI